MEDKSYRLLNRQSRLLGALILLLQASAFSQDTFPDSTVISTFRDKAIPYIDLGSNIAPFVLIYENSDGKREQLGYRDNVRAIFGAGFACKWFSLRLAANLPIHLEPVATSGKTIYRNFSLEFKIKRLFFDVGLHNYRGFAIKDAYCWEPALDAEKSPNLILPKINTLSISLNAWKFFNPNIDMSALKGKRAMYLKKQSSFFLKYTGDFQGLSNDGGSLIPPVKQNANYPITAAATLSSLDLGVLPGYLYVNRFRNWQYSVMLSAGPVFQSQFFYTGDTRKNSPGLAGRYDFRFYAGYNVPKWFLIFTSELENKSIAFKDLKYRQTIYVVKVVTGIRF